MPGFELGEGWRWGALLLGALHLLGIASAVHAVLVTRTPQGAIAWGLALLSLPYLALPLYWVLGRDRYRGYVVTRRSDAREFAHVERELSERVREFDVEVPADRPGLVVAERLAHMPFTRGNRLTLLVNGQATFDALRAGVEAAREYLLVQFFIWKDDDLGRAFRDLLAERARAGLAVYLLYDEIGSHALPRDFFDDLVHAGGRVRPFGTTRGWRNRFQINFRNHRKVVVADGRRAWVGGHNVGDEYLGHGPLGPWRDTHVELEGPAALGVQLSFQEDWYWAAHELPPWRWTPVAAEEGDARVLVLPTGPADPLETCSLAFDEAISAARERIWLTSPYFVPDAGVQAALQLAALRGVDVRVLLPERADHWLAWLAAYAFLEPVLACGVKVYRYQGGFLHQKVMLVDDRLAAVGTANLDNRSFRLNFELAVVVDDREFAREVEAMLEADLERCRQVELSEITGRGWLPRLGTRLARLFAPIL